MRTAVVSLATADRRFSEALARLERSLRRVGFDGEIRTHGPDAFPAGCPAQLDAPFAFKPFCFAEARDAGVDVVLWLDAACVAIRSLDPLLAVLQRDGHLVIRNGDRRLGEWCSDLTLAAFGLDREEALRLPEVNAAALGLDLRRPHAQEFLERWLAAAQAELPFRGVAERVTSRAEASDVKLNRHGRASADPRVRGHRHDQSVAGILAHQLGLTLHDGGIQPYSHRRRAIAPTTRIVLDRTTRGHGPLAPLHRIRRDRHLGRLVDRLARRSG